MKTTTLAFILLILTLAILIGLPEWLMAQAPPPPPDKPDQAPIGGLVLLATAGGAYAVKKLRDRKL
ncbi:MAG: hypothetical protein JJU37_15830 [Balneolaceae bacterium]|nr:hypothetical protein [Balneolaceae bacterium]